MSPQTARSAPPLDEALAALARRSRRAGVSLVARLVAVAVLCTLMERAIPALRRGQIAVEFVAVGLVLWPFFTALGRNFAWRIALGRSYARDGRWPEAEQTLRPFAKPFGQMFDATGEGAYWLAHSLQAGGNPDAALLLLGEIARHRRGTWRDRAISALGSRESP